VTNLDWGEVYSRQPRWVKAEYDTAYPWSLSLSSWPERSLEERIACPDRGLIPG
jgi:hypothetical protein